MRFTMVTDTAAKVQLTRDAAEGLGAKPFQGSQGSVVTRNGNVLLPIGAGWYWLSAFGAGSKAQASLVQDLLFLEDVEFAPKP